MKDFHKHLEKALCLDLDYYPTKTRPWGESQAAVLLLWKTGPVPSVLVTERTHQVEKHKGQMAFPGGYRDVNDASLLQVALRETEEEVGIRSNQIEVVGQLPPLFTLSSDVWVTPFVGVLREEVENLRLSEAEIASTVWVTLEQLRDPSLYRQEKFQHYTTHVYQIGSYRIWGATAAMIWNLMQRLEQIAQSEVGSPLE